MNRDHELEENSEASLLDQERKRTLLNIPADMQAVNQWVAYRLEQWTGETKPRKVPYQPSLSGIKASVTNSVGWGTFQKAASLPLTCIAACHPDVPLSETGFSGIGFVLTVADPFFCVDLDDTEGDAEALARQKKIFEKFNSWSEQSQSGHGAHIWGKGNIVGGRRREHVELYGSDRFIAVTGIVINNVSVADRSGLAQTLYAELGGDKASAAGIQPDKLETVSDDAIIASLCCEPARAALCNGDVSAVGGDYSKADMHIVNVLARLSGNRTQVERIWLASPLGQRDKTQYRADYRRRTIEAAFNELELPYVDWSGATAGGKPLPGEAAPQPPRPGIRASDLQHKQFAPVEWIVPGILTPGLTILGGRPKLGKSWLALDMGIAVAEGGYVIEKRCQPGDVAYYALEDTERRLQNLFC